LLAIEAQTTQGEAEDTIKLLENLLNPNKNASIPTFTDEEMNTYKSYTQQVKNEEQVSENTDSPALTKLKNILSDKDFTRKDLVELLAKNNITEKDGLKYAIYKKNVMIGSKSVLKQNLTEHILDAFNEGKITIF
jgi:hydroxymethylpyrimidine pyrophosphatase-like HAD family hydrolase